MKLTRYHKREKLRGPNDDEEKWGCEAETAENSSKENYMSINKRGLVLQSENQALAPEEKTY